MCTSDVLQTQTENFEQPKKTALLRNHQKCRECSDPSICTIFPIVWYCCNIWRPYKISNILYKTNEKAVSFLSTTSGTSRDLSWVPSFPLAAWRVFVPKHQKVCCSLLQWSDVHTWIWSRTCTVHFFRSSLRLFSSFPPIWVCEMKVLWKVASSRAEDLKPVFLYLAEYIVKNFITTRQYFVNLTCNCWFRMCTQLYQKLVSYKCMLFVDSLVVLWEYFVNWARVMKLQLFFWK